jgi:hypothetical protein
VVWREVNGGTGGEVRPEFPDGGIERQAGEERGAVRGRDEIGELMPADEIKEARVMKEDGFGETGRARGINHIC